MLIGMRRSRSIFIRSFLCAALLLIGVQASAQTLPASSITDPADGSTLPATLGSYSIKGVADDNGGGGLRKVEVSFDGGATWAAASDDAGNGSLTNWVYVWAPLPLGNHSIISRATDNLGRLEEPAPGTHVTVYVNPPVSSITDPADGAALPASLGSYNIKGVADENGGGGIQKVEISFDGGTTWAEASDDAGDGSLTKWVYVWAPLPLGNHSIVSRAVNDLGRFESPAPGTHVIVDGSPPVSSVTSPGEGALIAGVSYTITGTADDGAGSGVTAVEVSTDGGLSWAPASGTTDWSYDWTLPADGVYTIMSRATDRATNLETPAPGVSVRVDNTPPAGTISIDGGAEYTRSALAMLTLSAQDPGQGCPNVYPQMCAVGEMRFSVDGVNWGPWEPASTSRSWDLGAGDGLKTVYVNYKDDAGNVSAGIADTITLDTAPPSSEVTDPADGLAVNADSYDIAGGANDGTGSGVGNVDVSVDGGQTWNAATDTSGDGSLSSWAFHWAPLPLGNHSITVRATDNSGNAETPAAGVHLLVDRTQPSSAIGFPADGAVIAGQSCTVTGTASDEGVAGVERVEVSTDGGTTWSSASGTASWSYVWTPGADGGYTLTCRAVDAAGNVESPGAGVSVTVDTTPPASSITSPLDGGFVGGAATYAVTGTAGDGSGSGVQAVEVSIDGGAWQAASGTDSWSYQWTLPADGGYTITVRATDAAGNTETPVAGISVVVDNTPPSSTITSPGAGGYVGGSVYTVTGTADDGLGSGVQAVEVSTDGGVTWNAASGTAAWSYSWTLPADGTYTIQSRASDPVTNTETPGPGVTVTVDSTPPASLVAYPADGQLLGGASVCTITGTAADGAGSGVAAVEVSTDGGLTWDAAAGTNSWSYSWTLPPDGSYSIRSRAMDVAGNAETPGPGVTVTVDITPPSSAITAPAPGALVGGSPSYTVTGTAGDGAGSGVASVEVSTDGGVTWNAAAGTSSWSYSWTLPADGGYTVISRASDNAGNTETPGAGVTVTVDTTPPSGSIALKGGKYTKARNVQLILSARDAGSNCPEPDPVMCGIDMMQLSSDGINWQAWQTPATSESWHFSQGDGVKTIYVHYRDLAGNVSEDYNTTAIVDTVNPVSTVSDPADGATIVTSAYTISGTASDGGSGVAGVEVSTDGGSTWNLAAGMANWSWQWTPGADGSYNILSRATDSAGNVENPGPGVTVTVSLDSNPPTGSVSIDSGAQYTNSTDVTLSLAADDAGSGVTQMRISSDGTFDTEPWETYSASRAWTLEPGDGAKDVYVTYRDAAGNVSLACTDGITLDATPPGGSVVIDGGAQFTHDTAVSLDIAATDALSGVTQMQVSGDGLFDTEPWEPYSASRTWELPATEGVQVVYVRFMDAASNVSAYVVDDINLNYDAAPPVSSITAPGDGEYLSGVTYTVSGTASDPGTGVSRVEVSTDGGATWSDASGGATWTYSWVLPVSGPGAIMSRATDNAGNTETPSSGVSVTVAAYGSPELQHNNWDASLYGCSGCHKTMDVFLQAGFMSEPGFCGSCHNASGVAHESCPYDGRGHSVMASVTAAGRMPTYGNITTAEYNNRPASMLLDGDNVVCVTCHNPMQKTEDYGRTWEPTTTGDNATYALERGGWSVYGYMAPKVYRDTSLWAGPAFSRDKKAYLVNPSEYTYDEYAGTVTFNEAQDPLSYIYVSLDYPYLRASSQENRLCSDCHTEITHMGVNCLACHQAHGTKNLAGIRERLRAADGAELDVRFLGYTGAGSFADGDTAYDGICEVCHTATMYHRRDGSGFENHSGGVNRAGSDCTACHTHASGFAR